MRKGIAPVVFVTDRKHEDGRTELALQFGTARDADGKISCGTMGSSNTTKHGLDPCLNLISSVLKTSDTTHFLVFVHGYKNSFADALGSARELAKNLRYVNPIIVWSWPSDGHSFSYLYDSESVRWSERNASEFFRSLLDAIPEARIDFFAHSMGTRLLLALLKNSKLRSASPSITFAAPDEAQDIFSNSMRSFGKLTSLNTLYASDRDRALRVSTYLNSPSGQSISRAGSGGQNILLLDEIESVEATDISSGSGHSYVFQEDRAVEDIETILLDLKGAQDRGLKPKQLSGRSYWQIEP